MIVVKLKKSVAGPYGGAKNSTVSLPDNIARSWIKHGIAEEVVAAPSAKRARTTSSKQAEKSEKRGSQGNKRTGKRTRKPRGGKGPFTG